MGTAQFADFAEMAEAEVIRVAERYDPDRGAKFSIYLHRRLRGATIDWRNALVPMVYLDQPLFEDSGGRDAFIDRLLSGRY